MTITLREAAYDRLRAEALAERRPAREHAAYLLERQLLADPPTEREAVDELTVEGAPA